MLNLSKNSVNKELEDLPLYAIKLVNNPKHSRIIARWLMGIFLFAILCLFLPWQQNIEGYGTVMAYMPEERPQGIQTLIAGRIDSWRVQEGQFVKKGDTIMILSEIKEKFFDPLLLERINNQISAKESSIQAKEQKVKALESQIQALRNSLDLSSQKAYNKVNQSKLYITIDSTELQVAQADYEIAKAQYQRQEKMYEQGLVSLTNLEQRKFKFQQTGAKVISTSNKFGSAKNDLLNSRIEINSIQAEYSEKIFKAESDRENTLSDYFEAKATLSKLRTEYANMQMRNELYVIRAPQDGFIIKAAKHGIGETVKEGEEVITIGPDKRHLAAEIYIKPMDVPLLTKGTKVRIQFDGWPALVFSGWPGVSVGSFGGVVQVIDYVTSNNGKFRVLVTPDPDDQPWPEQIRLGSGVMGWGMLNRVMVGYELWRQFNGFPPDFITKNITNKYKKKSKGKGDEDEEK